MFDRAWCRRERTCCRAWDWLAAHLSCACLPSFRRGVRRPTRPATSSIKGLVASSSCIGPQQQSRQARLRSSSFCTVWEAPPAIPATGGTSRLPIGSARGKPTTSAFSLDCWTRWWLSPMTRTADRGLQAGGHDPRHRARWHTRSQHALWRRQASFSGARYTDHHPERSCAFRALPHRADRQFGEAMALLQSAKNADVRVPYSTGPAYPVDLE